MSHHPRLHPPPGRPPFLSWAAGSAGSWHSICGRGGTWQQVKREDHNPQHAYPHRPCPGSEGPTMPWFASLMEAAEDISDLSFYQNSFSSKETPRCQAALEQSPVKRIASAGDGLHLNQRSTWGGVSRLEKHLWELCSPWRKLPALELLHHLAFYSTTR